MLFGGKKNELYIISTNWLFYSWTRYTHSYQSLTKTISKRTRATVPIVFLFCACLPNIFHNHGKSKTPFGRPRITAIIILICDKNIQICGNQIQLKIKKGVPLHIRKKLARDFDKIGGIKGIGSDKKLEALLDSRTSLYRKGIDLLHRNIRNLVDNWNNRWNYEQYFEKFTFRVLSNTRTALKTK